jgi:hypothetical protein
MDAVGAGFGFNKMRSRLNADCGSRNAELGESLQMRIADFGMRKGVGFATGFENPWALAKVESKCGRSQTQVGN